MAGQSRIRIAAPVIIFLGTSVSAAVAQGASASSLNAQNGLVATTRIGDSGHLQLTSRNASNKVVSAYKLRWSKGRFTEQSTDLISALMPSVDPRRRLGLGSTVSLDDPFGPATRPLDIAVVGVVYDDNSWEGEPGFAQTIFTIRRQHALAIERMALPILTSGTGVSRIAEHMRSAAQKARQSRNLDELSAAQYLSATADHLDRIRNVPPDMVKNALASIVNDETALLRVLKAHMQPATASP